MKYRVTLQNHRSVQIKADRFVIQDGTLRFYGDSPAVEGSSSSDAFEAEARRRESTVVAAFMPPHWTFVVAEEVVTEERDGWTKPAAAA